MNPPMSELLNTQHQGKAREERKPRMTKEERIEMQKMKREERRASREAKKAAKREEYEKNTVEITYDELIKFKEWKRSQAKIRVNKEQYEVFLASASPNLWEPISSGFTHLNKPQ